ncbi:MAG TPA: LCP family protein [Streptosporangiaceae bacterium]|nr:LCP family protein [Streptosporangiaceae bacterium]
MNDWPERWYRDETPRRPAGGSMSNAPTASYRGGAGQPGAGRAYGAGRGSSWPSQPPARTAPGRRSPEGPPDGWQPSGRRRRFGPKRIFQIVAAVVILVIVGAVAFYFYLDSKLNRSVTLPAYSGQSAGQNWLITGADSRQGLSRQQIDSLHVGFNFGTLNSDSLMLLHTGSSGPVLISIPRDSYVPIPGHGENKINAALGFGGPSLLIQTVEEVTGLRIDHYMGIGFGGLVSVVNNVGGVKVCLPTALHDSNSGINLPAGCHNLDGSQALAFVRDRHSFATQDLQRIEDQRAFLKALLSKATSPGVYLNPFTALPFGSAAASSISVDQGTHLYNLITAALALRNPETGTIPIANANYPTANAGDTVLWNHSQALELFSALKNDQKVPAGLLSGTKVG